MILGKREQLHESARAGANKKRHLSVFYHGYHLTPDALTEHVEAASEVVLRPLCSQRFDSHTHDVAQLGLRKVS